MMKKRVISIVLSLLMGIVIGACAIYGTILKKTEELKRLSDKHFALFFIMNQWVKVKQDGKNLSGYFEANGYRNIAVYGMSYVGETFVNELKKTNTCIVYGIDQNADKIHIDIDIFTREDRLPKVDAIIVTSIFFFDEIKKELSKKVDCPIISLEDVLYEI